MKSESVALLHPHDHDLGLYLLERLPEDSLLAMEAHLANCEACDRRLVREVSSVSAQGVTKLGTAVSGEMRKEPRFKTDEDVWLQTLNPFSPDRYSGRLADVSRNGMKLGIAVRVECGTLIKISLKSMIAFGEVRYCVPVGDAFHFGVQVSQIVPRRSPE